MISYLDQHNGAVTAIATVALTVITAIYAFLTRRMVLEMQKAREPFITIDMELPDPMLRVIVANLGQSPARNIRFSIEKDLAWLSVGDGSSGIGAIPAIKNGCSVPHT